MFITTEAIKDITRFIHIFIQVRIDIKKDKVPNIS